MNELNKLYDFTLQRKTTAVLAACDDKYAFCLYVSLKSLILHSPLLSQDADIWVASFHISPKHKEILSTLPNLRIFEYDFPGSLLQTPDISHFTNVSFARYELFTLLKLYKQVLYLDSDVLVQKELLPVFNHLQDGIGLIPDNHVANIRQNFLKPVPGFNMNVNGYNSGFIVLNRNGEWIHKVEEIRQFLYQTTRQHAEILGLPDQGILNLAIQKFHFNVTSLTTLYNLPASRARKKLKDAFIIHCTGPRKFWGYYYFDGWYQLYTTWIKQGGAPLIIRQNDSNLFKIFISKWNLNKYVFFQVCPDPFKKPLKFLVFTFKRIFRIQF